jgi:hypothetical protein
VECRRVCGLLAGAAWPKEKLAPTAGAGADVSAGLAEKLNDGVGPVDPVEEAAVEVLVAEKEKAPDPDDVEGAVDVACPKENDGADEELEVVEAPALKLNAGAGPVEAVDDLSELAPPNEKATELSVLVVAVSETGFAAPKEKLGRGSVSADEAVVSEVFGNPPKENAGAPLAGAAVVVDVVADVDPARPEPKVGKVLGAVDTGSLVLSPKPPKLGTGRDLTESVFSLLSAPVRLNVTVLFLVVALDDSDVEVGDEIVPIENGVAVVEVTDDNVAESVVVAVLSFSVVVLLLRPNANPTLPES